MGTSDVPIDIASDAGRSPVDKPGYGPVTASLRPSCIPPQSHLLKGFRTEASRVLRNWLSTKSGLKFSNLEAKKSVVANIESMSAVGEIEMKLNGSTTQNTENPVDVSSKWAK